MAASDSTQSINAPRWQRARILTARDQQRFAGRTIWVWIQPPLDAPTMDEFHRVRAPAPIHLTQVIIGGQPMAIHTDQLELLAEFADEDEVPLLTVAEWLTEGSQRPSR